MRGATIQRVTATIDPAFSRQWRSREILGKGDPRPEAQPRVALPRAPSPQLCPRRGVPEPAPYFCQGARCPQRPNSLLATALQISHAGARSLRSKHPPRTSSASFPAGLFVPRDHQWRAWGRQQDHPVGGKDIQESRMRSASGGGRRSSFIKADGNETAKGV